jgi:DNA-directed RNA polymerase subunit K/omega
MKKEDSRGYNIDTEKCVELAGGNKYDLVLIASVRAREIAKQNREREAQEYINPAVTALLELQNGQFDKNLLKQYTNPK